MKKCLLALSMSLLMGYSLVSAEAVKAPFAVKQMEIAQSRTATDDGYQLRFCGDLYTWYRLTTKANATYKCYIEITPDIATNLAGNTLTDISFCACIQSASTKPGNIFISENLEGDPVISQDVTIKNGYKNGYAEVQTVTLDTPYVIKEGVGFVFGYTVTKCSSSDYPLGADEGGSSPFSGTSEVYDTKGDLLTSVNLSNDGHNLFLYANTIGEKKTIYDVYAVNALSFGDFSLPVVSMFDGKIDVPAIINNIGSNPVTSVGFSYSLNGAEEVSGTVDTEVPGETKAIVNIPVEGVSSGKNNVVEIAVTSINGNEMTIKNRLKFLAIEGEGYERKFVVEEGTGTWCGWCPRGIVGMEAMAEAHPEKFIGIAVHSGDVMAVSSYNSFLSKYFSGYPSCIVNRDPNYNIDPSQENLEAAYELWISQPAPVDVDFVVTKTSLGFNVTVDASTVFAFDDANATYSLAFVIIEDGIKGVQTNYYAGGSYGEMGGWQNKGSEVAWTYLDTARDIFDVYGISKSIPTSVEKGVSYEYQRSLNMRNVKNIENTSVVALVLDKTSGTILNAKKVKYADYADPKEDGINDISADASAPVEYYNIQGVRMDGDNLPSGLYITRQGNKVQKTIIR